jgi:probable phosphoglycerate mutase
MAQPYRFKLVFVRHGRTSYNAENRLQGQRDIPLDGKGREQAGAVGRFLRAYLGEELPRLEANGAFWSSPLARTRLTMELVRTAMGAPPGPYHVDPRLKELSFGAWEGLTWAEIGVKYPGAQEMRDADKWAFAPGLARRARQRCFRRRAWRRRTRVHDHPRRIGAVRRRRR